MLSRLQGCQQLSGEQRPAMACSAHGWRDLNDATYRTPFRPQVCQQLSGEEQWAIYTEAHSAWYISLVMCQFWHIWLCKTRQVGDERDTGTLVQQLAMRWCMVSFVRAQGKPRGRKRRSTDGFSLDR